MPSPYEGQPQENWQEITNHLVRSHPLNSQLILEAAQISWRRLWTTYVGDRTIGFPLADIAPPATVVAYMFEKLFAKELAAQFPSSWRGGVGSEKDLHCMYDESLSVEMKASGQLGYKVYGNRSYGQALENEDAGKKDKSGFYITVNFFKHNLTLLRFGWIDSTDWRSQQSATGQMAGLSSETYNHKLISIRGDYELDGPVQLIPGLGEVAAAQLSSLGILTIRELIVARTLPRGLMRHQELATTLHKDKL